MENVISAIIVIGLMVVAVVGLSERSFSSQAVISESSQEMQERVGERSRTALTAVAATTTGSVVQVTLRNTGSTKLANWSDWDVILQYSNGGGRQLKWSSYGVMDGWGQQIVTSLTPLTAEVIEPGILNPGEYLVIQADVSSAPVATGSTNQVTVVAPNGVTATAIFTY